MSSVSKSAELLSEFGGRLRAPLSADELVPPPRFNDKTFANYEVGQPEQAAAVARVQSFALAGPRRWWQWSRRDEQPGLYLDGDFGVGKTHLLAAAWHACRGPKRYLCFSDMISLAIILGHRGCVDLLASELVCIDEFELDDPGNTRLADLVIDGLVARGSRIVVTSNTVPGELGHGRLFVDQFRRQLARVAAAFADVHVPGEDYRQRFRAEDESDPPGWGVAVEAFDRADAAVLGAEELDKVLSDIPIANLRRLAAALPRLTVRSMSRFEEQLPALRFVHLVDRLYDWQVPLRVQSDTAIRDLFSPEFRELGFAKKYRRCCSRLVELCGESTPA